MQLEILQGLTIPFLGTTLGAACVFFMRGAMRPHVQKGLTGFASGIMVAASIWSLLMPAIEESQELGPYASLPAIAGFWFGTLFLLALDHIIPHLHMNAEDPEGPRSSLSKNAMMVLAVTLHNIPEGMAVGVVLAGWLTDSAGVSLSAALALSIGIAIQNFPEGAIISMPLAAGGASRGKAFMSGVLSGVVEPIGGALTILAASFVVPVLPYLLAFAAGAMMYVVVEELIPEMSAGEHSNVGVITFTAGFTLMMALDTILG
ncbi:ZIP family metal transporter [uncultured Mitsuokella sp.]|uniref:ZIP family metal transporter n=1 Tax=uncultured Mitsuokella sp. TaxID=453120 RepID=UPI002617F0E7|nr:ZIP family metal transporter [uncultured Mitsuokella sp.]